MEKGRGKGEKKKGEESRSRLVSWIEESEGKEQVWEGKVGQTFPAGGLL